MDKKIQSSSVFLDKVSQLQSYVCSTDKKKYDDVKNEYCKNGKQGLFRVFENKKIRQIAIQEASQEGDIQILKKWKQYHLLKQNDQTYIKRDIQKTWITFIVSNENLNSLEWWYKNQKDIIDQYLSDIQIETCKQGKLYILDWCKQKTDIQWEMSALENLPNNKTLKVLDWWYENKQWTNLAYREQLIDKLCQYCEIEQLQWFYDMRKTIKIKYTELAIENACKQGNVNVLNWWYCMRDILKMKYDEQAIEQACKNKKDNVIRWWISKPELQLKYNEQSQFIQQYKNILRQNKYKESQLDDICQICHDILKHNQVFECVKCRKQFHKSCYQQLKEKYITECPNCKSQLFM